MWKLCPCGFTPWTGRKLHIYHSSFVWLFWSLGFCTCIYLYALGTHFCHSCLEWKWLLLIMQGLRSASEQPPKISMHLLSSFMMWIQKGASFCWRSYTGLLLNTASSSVKFWQFRYLFLDLYPALPPGALLHPLPHFIIGTHKQGMLGWKIMIGIHNYFHLYLSINYCILGFLYFHSVHKAIFNIKSVLVQAYIIMKH